MSETEHPNTSYTMDSIQSLIVMLHPDEVYWKTDSGAITLDRISGQVSAKIPKKLSELDKLQIVNGLNSCLIIESDAMIEAAAVKPVPFNGSLNQVYMYRLLDERNVQTFATKIKTISSVSFMNDLVELERSDRNRESHMSVLTSRLKEISA